MKKTITHLQSLYDADEFVDFELAFIEAYTKASTKKRLALLLHFSCEWYMAETFELPRKLIEIA